jgi:uncharacterized integral membrane protein (TIGR00697 family)
MTNELIFLLELIADFCLCLLVYKWLRRDGLVMLIVLHIIMCNIAVVKEVELFGIQATLGNIAYGVTFWITDLISEKYGKRQAKRGVLISFVALVAFSLMMLFVPYYIPGPSDRFNDIVTRLFTFVPRLTLASLTAFLISQLYDVWMFNFIRELTQARHLWLRYIVATFLSQLIDTLVFCTLAFIGIFSWPVLIQVYISTWLLKLLVGFLDTPFIYFATRWEWLNPAHLKEVREPD